MYKFNPDYPCNSWNEFFNNNKDLLNKLWSNIEDKSSEYKHLIKIYPPSDKVYRAFDLCELNDIKVVIVGQDCYHGPGQANGLCFSVDNETPIPPSLRNILKEMETDEINRTNPDFSELAKQGVLFLNSALTVFEKLPESMLEYWSEFTDNVIKHISNNTRNVVFILWGNFAKDKSKLVDLKKHCIISGNHPSPLSANRGGFFNGKYFSKANEYLITFKKDPIDWVK
jgi:uracil-DNA glycosylase